MNGTIKRIMIAAAVIAVALAAGFSTVTAQGTGQPGTGGTAISIPGLTSNGTGNGGSGRLSLPIEIVLGLTVLSLAPAILVMMTSFTRIVVVFSFLRQALGTQQMPPAQLLVGLALFLTIVIMMPVFTEINDTALQPYLSEQMGRAEAIQKGFGPLRVFMLKQTREKDMALFMKLKGDTEQVTPETISASVLIPAFVISELRTAFQIGFLIYLPFLVIDMVVASVLMSMGMMMLPPVMISLPFKILLFVLVDGWHLLVQSLVVGFQN